MFHKSIRWRIQIWHGALLLCLVAAMMTAFYLYERAERFQIVDSRLQNLLTQLLPRVSPPGGPDFDDGPPRGPERRRGPGPGRGGSVDFSEFVNGAFYYKAWAPSGEVISQSSAANNAAVPVPAGEEPAHGQYARSRGGFRELLFRGPDGSKVVVGTSTVQVAHDLRQLAWALCGIGLGLVFFGLAGGWWVAGHALRPIGEISATAREIAGGSRARRINTGETESELGQLAEMLNQAFDKQDAVIEQQVRFTADASHELRTPVTVILTQVQLALSREREAGEYRETLKVCQRAAERMRGLVNSLLELARVDAGDLQLKMENCDLSTLATESMELVAPLAREKSAVLSSSIQPVKTKADSARLSQVVVNLLYNAIQHNSNGVEVRLSVQTQGHEAVVRVSDNGAGIPAEALPHVFERFYRVDQSRTGGKGGHGLGLAISQAIVQAHGGTIRAESPAGQGAIFTVCLPLAG